MEFNKIVDRLYLGPAHVNQYQAADLQREGVTHIVSITKRDCSFHPTLFSYRQVNLDDEVDAPIEEHFIPIADHIGIYRSISSHAIPSCLQDNLPTCLSCPFS